MNEPHQPSPQEDQESDLDRAETYRAPQGDDIQIYEDGGGVIEDDKENDIDKGNGPAQPRANNSEEALEAFSVDNPIAFNLVPAHSEYRDTDDEAADYDDSVVAEDSDVEEIDRHNSLQRGHPSPFERTPVKNVAVGQERQIYSDEWTAPESPSVKVRVEQSSRPNGRRSDQERPLRALFVPPHSENDSDDVENKSSTGWEDVSHRSSSANANRAQRSRDRSLPEDETKSAGARSQSIEVDVSIALPPQDNGDDFQSSQGYTKNIEPPPNRNLAATNTQAIIDVETQELDLSIPLPPPNEQDQEYERDSDVYDVPPSLT